MSARNCRDHVDDEPVFLVCQYCGTTENSRFDRAGWHVARHKNFRDVWIVRCPDHISEWAIRNSAE